MLNFKLNLEHSHVLLQSDLKVKVNKVLDNLY